jgi:putative colanic acid biosynthesis acetyltransferase WcaF
MTSPTPPPPPASPDPAAGTVPAGHELENVTDTTQVDPWPYTPGVYAARVLWAIVHATVWKLAWKRFPWARCTILRAFGATTGLRNHIAGSVRIEMPFWVELGDHVAIGPRASLYNLGGISIGDHSVVSQDVYFCGGTHDYTDPAYPLLRKKIVVGKHAWVAAGAFIGPGVTIGDGAVVGARAVVMKDVEPWTVVAGNPAKFVKNRVMKR